MLILLFMLLLLAHLQHPRQRGPAFHRMRGSAAGSGGAAFAPRAGQPQFFVLPDVGIEEMTGCERRVHSAQKQGAVIRPAPDNAHGYGMQTRSTPQWAQGRWQLPCSDGWYTSPDGIQWVRDGSSTDGPNAPSPQCGRGTLPGKRLTP